MSTQSERAKLVDPAMRGGDIHARFAAGHGAAEKGGVAEKRARTLLQPTPHPAWVERMLGNLATPWERACWPSLFADTVAGRHPPLSYWQRALAHFFIIVENFPKYMGLTLAKTTYGRRPGDAAVRRWLLKNLGVEAKHAEWYVDWMRGAGVIPEAVFHMKPADEIGELHDHLLETCRNGTLAEGVAASNWAIEGVTGVWSRAVAAPFHAYAADGAKIDDRSMFWLSAHAAYDDHHPEEALEILKLYVDPAHDDPARVEAAARRSLELFRSGMDRCIEA